MKKIMMATLAAMTAFTALPAATAQAQGISVQIGGGDRYDRGFGRDRCRIERVRTVRPGGRVVIREERVCRPNRYVRRRDDCRVREVRTVRPNGRVVIRQERICR